MKCNGKNRQGEPCGNEAINGASKCRFHGGASLIGVASPTFKHGRYSKHLPTRLAARYAEALSDPQLLELRDEIALVGTRQTELLEQLDSGLSLARLRIAQSAYSDLMAAMLYCSSVVILHRTLYPSYSARTIGRIGHPHLCG
jgi:hypothetical protein